MDTRFLYFFPHSMIYWGNPEATGKLMKGVTFAFIMSICLPERWLFFFFGMFCPLLWIR